MLSEMKFLLPRIYVSFLNCSTNDDIIVDFLSSILVEFMWDKKHNNLKMKTNSLTYSRSPFFIFLSSW